MRARSAAALVAAHAAGNALLLRAMLFSILEEDSPTMAYLDPSVIIATPLPVRPLCRFVAASLAWTLLVALARWKTKSDDPRGYMDARQSKSGSAPALALAVGLASAAVHSVLVLCGIHPVTFPVHTAISALYVAINALLPPILFTPDHCMVHRQYGRGGSMARGAVPLLKEVGDYLLGPSSLEEEETKKELSVSDDRQRQRRRGVHVIHRHAILGMVTGMSVCAILRVLDHGMQVQRHPVPIAVGATFGRCGGVLTGALSAALS